MKRKERAREGEETKKLTNKTVSELSTFSINILKSNYVFSLTYSENVLI